MCIVKMLITIFCICHYTNEIHCIPIKAIHNNSEVSYIYEYND